MSARAIFNRRELWTAGAVAVTARPLIAAATSKAAYETPHVDPLSLVSLDLRDALAQWRRDPGDFAINAANLARVRKLSEPTVPNAPTPPYAERSIPGPKGAPDVRVVVINPAESGPPRPAILHIHGGGFVAGTVEEVIPKLQRLAHEHDCVIVTVDYRLAPETRFPGSLEDNYAALRWLYRSAKALGVDTSRIAVAGESAGGGHAAMLAIAARDRGEVPIAFQLLIYPMLDDRTGSSRPVPPVYRRVHLGGRLESVRLALPAGRCGWLQERTRGGGSLQGREPGRTSAGFCWRGGH